MTNLHNSDQEIWKDIPGYEGLYKISETGVIYSVINNNFLKLFLTNNGYLTTSLKNNKVRATYFVHRLVAKTFIGEAPTPELVINHKDGVKTNNHFTNLEWCTRRYNTLHAIRTGLIKDNGFRASQAKAVSQIQNGKVIATFKSTIEAGKANGFDRTAIGACARGKLKHAYGFQWKYVA
jgi:hypothetical protein